MMKCTEPERWARVPGADAAEEDVVNYLAHVSACPFHAAIEQREETRLRGVAALARLDLESSGAQSGANVATNSFGLDPRVKHRSKASGHTLSIRVDGVERVRFDLTSQREATLEVAAGASLVAVWRAGADEEVYLTSFLLSAERALTSAKVVSEKVLDGGDRITLTAVARASARTQLTVAYTATGWLRARQLSMAQRTRAAAERARTIGQSPVPQLATVLLALVAALLLVQILFSQIDEQGPVTKQEQTQPAGEGHAPPPPQSSLARSATNPQSHQDVAPAASLLETPAPTRTPHAMYRSRRDRRSEDSLAASLPRPNEQLTVGGVRRIYVSLGAGAENQQLREALVKRLRATNRFTVVSGKQQADALLLREQSASAGVSVQLVTRTGKILWFSTQSAAAGGAEDVGDVAGRIVAGLTAAADKRLECIKCYEVETRGKYLSVHSVHAALPENTLKP